MIKRLWASPRRWVYVSLMGLAGLAILGGLGGDSDYWSVAGGSLAVLGYWVWMDARRG
jgi:hypothetical protein